MAEFKLEGQATGGGLCGIANAWLHSRSLADHLCLSLLGVAGVETLSKPT